MIGWRKKILKPWKSAHCRHFRVSVHGLQSTPFDIGTYFWGWMILGTWDITDFIHHHVQIHLSPQINGHIRANVSMPQDRNDYSAAAITRMMLEAIQQNPMTKKESSAQRHKFFMDAYSHVPLGVFEAIQLKYKFDFEMFGYNMYLQGLHSWL